MCVTNHRFVDSSTSVCRCQAAQRHIPCSIQVRGKPHTDILYAPFSCHASLAEHKHTHNNVNATTTLTTARVVDIPCLGGPDDRPFLQVRRRYTLVPPNRASIAKAEQMTIARIAGVLRLDPSDSAAGGPGGTRDCGGGGEAGSCHVRCVLSPAQRDSANCGDKARQQHTYSVMEVHIDTVRHRPPSRTLPELQVLCLCKQGAHLARRHGGNEGPYLCRQSTVPGGGPLWQ